MGTAEQAPSVFAPQDTPDPMSATTADSGSSLELEQTSVVLDANISQLHGLYAGAGNAVASALETFKVFKPEINRLGGKTVQLEHGLERLGEGLQGVRGDLSGAQQAAAARMAAMEQRIADFEAFVAALPTWKDELGTKIDMLGKESRLKVEQLTLKTNMLEEAQMQSVQVTRERLDSLTTLAKTGMEARACQTERIEKLEDAVRQVEGSSSNGIHELQVAIKKHDEAIMVNTRHGMELNIKVGMARVDIDALKERLVLVEDAQLLGRGELAQLRDRQDGTDNSITLAASLMNKMEISQNGLFRRIEAVERDPRVPRLMAAFDEFHEHQQDAERYQKAINARVASFEKQLTRLDGKVERGPPGLWKVTEQVAKHAEALSASRAEAKRAQQSIEQLQLALQEARRQLGEQRAAAEALRAEGHELQDRLAAGLQRGLRYADGLREHVAAAADLEALRRDVAGVKAELQEGISAMGIRVKFDLLHDEAPQVADIKAYLQSVDVALGRNREKVAYLEEGLVREQARGKLVEAAWASTKESLDLLILNGELDVHKLRKDLTAVKAMFEEMGQLSVRGDILTVTRAEELIEEKLGGRCIDDVLARKVHERGPLAARLEGLASKHDVEAVRKLVMQMGQEDGPGNGAGTRPRSATAAAGGGGGAAQGAEVLDQAPLKLLYQRMAGAEEAAGRAESQCAALDARLQEMEAGGGAGRPTAALPPPPSAHSVEAAVRDVVNRTLLPEVLGRQVADTQHLLRFVAAAAERGAKGYEVEALRKSMAALRAGLEDVQRDRAGGSEPPPGDASADATTQQRLAALEEHLAAAAAAAAASAAAGGPEAGASAALRQVEDETRARVLEARLNALEGRVAELGPAHQGGPGEPVHGGSGLQQQVSELQGLVSGLVAQQPLAAKAFEVDGVRQALAGLRAEVAQCAAQAWGAGAPPPPPPLPLGAGGSEDPPGERGGISEAAAAAEGVREYALQQWQERLAAVEVGLHVLEKRVQGAEGGVEAAGAAQRQELAGVAAAVAAVQQGLGELRAEVEAGGVLVNERLSRLGGLSPAEVATAVEAEVGEVGLVGEGEEGEEAAAGAAAPRAMAAPERADAELSGLVHDVVHAAHEELVATHDGPLPGSGAGLQARNVREAALRRLGARPPQTQRHVELLEAAKRQLSRLVSCAAVSTVDHLCLGLVMLDMRVKLLDDAVDLHKEQMAGVFGNLEATFEYLRKLQEAMDTKAAAAAVAGLDRAMRALARELVEAGARDAAPPAGGRLGSPEFWGALLGDIVGGGSGGAPPTPAFVREDSSSLLTPSRGGSMYGGGGGGYASPTGPRSRPGTARSHALQVMAPLPSVTLPGMAPSSPKSALLASSTQLHPPPNFYKEKRNIQEEQERLISQAGGEQPAVRQQAVSELGPEGRTRPASRSASPAHSPSPQMRLSSAGRPRTALPRPQSSHPANYPQDSLPRLSQMAGGLSLLNLVPLKPSPKGA